MGNEFIIDILDEILGERMKSNEGKQQVSYDCPVCSEDIKGLNNGDGKGNFEVNYRLGVYKCWACSETHGTHGSLRKLMNIYATKRIKDRYFSLVDGSDFEYSEANIITEKIELPKEYVPLSNNTKEDYQTIKVIRYLKSRAITQDIISRNKIGFCQSGKYSGRVIIPSYDKYGELNYFISRSYVNHKMKYLNPVTPKEEVIFNEDKINWNKNVFLVEGVFDSLFIPNSIPMLGKVMSDKLWEVMYGKLTKKIFIVLDSDAWGDAIKLYKKLDGGKLKEKVFLTKVPNDTDVADIVKNYGIDELKKILLSSGRLKESTL
jgi:DNA primase|tara:strand:+ start:67017 stop:67973 length:957 start_codon:yes stop_codon:yes gene_type:complete